MGWRGEPEGGEFERPAERRITIMIMKRWEKREKREGQVERRRKS